MPMIDLENGPYHGTQVTITATQQVEDEVLYLSDPDLEECCAHIYVVQADTSKAVWREPPPLPTNAVTCYDPE
jgi:hypothetical protein